MREYLADPPRWVLGLLAGVPFGLASGIYAWLDEQTWVFAVVWGLLAGVFFGFTFALVFGRWLRQQQHAIGDTPPAIRSAAARAAWRGPVPADPEVRLAALRVATTQLDATLRWRTAAIISWGLLLVVTIRNALDEPWRFGVAVFYLLLLGNFIYGPKRLRARIKLLSSTDPSDESAQRDQDG